MHQSFADSCLTTWLCRRIFIKLKTGAKDEARTRDINLGKVALYQLSYSRAVRIFILMNFKTLSSFLFICLLVRGGSAETRTLDRRIKSPLLYQLSYAPIASNNFLQFPYSQPETVEEVSQAMSYFHWKYNQLSSALRRFTVLFGMGRSGTTLLWSLG